jgi:hypothetical protein
MHRLILLKADHFFICSSLLSIEFNSKYYKCITNAFKYPVIYKYTVRLFSALLGKW